MLRIIFLLIIFNKVLIQSVFCFNLLDFKLDQTSVLSHSLPDELKKTKILASHSTLLVQNQDQDLEAMLLKSEQYSQKGQPLKAIEILYDVLELVQTRRNKRYKAIAYYSLGRNFNLIGEYEKALNYYNQALITNQQVRDLPLEGTILNGIGLVHHYTGQPEKALNYYNQALNIRRQVQDLRGEAATLNNMGMIYVEISQFQEALNYFNQALPINQDLEDLRTKAIILNNIGLVHSRMGQFQEALNYYNQALPIRRQIQDIRGEATTLQNIGEAYAQIGQFQEALNYYSKALPMSQQGQDLRRQAEILTNTGYVYLRIEQPEEALGYYKQALPISRKLKYFRLEAEIINAIGGAYEKLGNTLGAIEYYKQALIIRRNLGYISGEVASLGNIGYSYLTIGQSEKALNYLIEALRKNETIENPTQKAIILSSLGLIYRNNQPDKAISYFEESLKITLRIRGDLIKENRQEFLDIRRRSVDFLIDLLIKNGQTQKAYEWANLYSTYTLANYNHLIGGKVANPQAQKALDDWNSQNQELEARLQDLQENFSEIKAREFRKIEEKVNRQREPLISQYPELAELLEYRSTELAQLQKNIPSDTLVIHPILLNGSNYASSSILIFMITSNNLKVIQNNVNLSDVNKLIVDHKENLENFSDPDPNYEETGSKLYNLLIHPIENHIQKISPKKIAFITTDNFHGLPMETLYKKEKEQFFIAQYPIYYLTRISKDKRLSSNIRDTSFKVLVFANPQPTQRNLLGTEAEAKYILNSFPESSVYMREKATLDNFKNNAIQFPIIHLGTHGCFDPQGCNTLKMKPNTLLFANNKTYPIADAALLGLKGTELIVLSACQTAKEINEANLSLPGLAYVFERAGAKSIIASLWLSEDTKTLNLMSDFYSYLNEGMSKSGALQKAKLKQINDIKIPFFWSNFILLGKD